MIAFSAAKFTCIHEFTYIHVCAYVCACVCVCVHTKTHLPQPQKERWGAGVETQKNVRGEVGGWGRVPFNEPYAPSLSTIYDGA